MKQNNKKKGKSAAVPVRVSIVSQIRDLTPDEDGRPISFRLTEHGIVSDPDVETIEYRTDGVLSDDGETVSITYDESEEMGFEQSSTTLSFSRSMPGTVTMVRSGDGGTACRFSEAEPRQHCVYNTGFMPIELIINTHAVENDFSDFSGRIALDYTVELRGMTTERNRLMIDYRPTSRPAPKT